MDRHSWRRETLQGTSAKSLRATVGTADSRLAESDDSKFAVNLP